MSFVILKKFENKFLAYGDTRIILPKDRYFSPDFIRDNGHYGAMKLMILKPDIVMAYAGDPDTAAIALKEIQLSGDYDIENIKRILLKVHIDSELSENPDKSTDFALVIINESREVDMFKIAECKIVEPVSDIWLGDQLASDYYDDWFDKAELIQMHESVIASLEENIIWQHKVAAAFDKVIKNPEITKVGGFSIGVAADHQKLPGKTVFSYISKLSYTQGMPVTLNVSPDWTPLPLKSNAELGSYVVTHNDTVLDGHHGLAIHLYENDMRLFYCPDYGLRPLLLIEDKNTIT